MLKEINDSEFIIYDELVKSFTINTANSAYQMKVDSLGVLLHTWYGEKMSGIDYSYLIDKLPLAHSGNPSEMLGAQDRWYSLDILPQEFPQYGTGDFRINAFELLWPDGSRASDFRYHQHKIYSGKYCLEGLPSFYIETADSFYNDDRDLNKADNLSNVETLEIILKDKYEELYLHLYYAVFPEFDIITRASKVINRTKETLYILKQDSACVDFPAGDFEILHFAGRHIRERQTSVSKLNNSIFQIRSSRGSSSHQHNPSVILKRPETNEEYGEAYAFALVYSGGFNISIEKDQLEQSRLCIGLDDSNFKWCLAEGESFQSPEAMLAYSDTGLGDLSQNIHQAVNKYLIKGAWKYRRRPVLINNWEATYFDFTREKLLDIAREAVEIGFDLFVMDDGWFGSRNSDLMGLGDWFPNEDKLGGSIKDLVEDINALGIDFGLWFEPEMVNEDSELYRAHPDWAIRIPGREPNRSRSQLLLDMSRDDVIEYLKTCFDNILADSNIVYIKWDMNRSLSDLYSNSLSADRQGELSHRFVLGTYKLLNYLTEEYPNILIEGCSGGGGRFDLGMLHYTPQIWTSDNTDAIERCKIQYGTSFIYPVSTISAHVSVVPNHQNARVTPIKTRGITAMQGAFGYELDLTNLSEAEKYIAKKQIKFFNEHWELIQKGLYFRIENPFSQNYYNAWEFVDLMRDKALMAIVFKDLESSGLRKRIKWKALDPERKYRIYRYAECAENFLLELSGLDLMVAGFLIDRAKENYDSVWYLAIAE